MLERLKNLLQEELLREKHSDQAETALPDQHTFVARQPVFEKNGLIWGYELLYRRPENTVSADVTNGTVATANVIMNGFEMVRPSLKKGQKVLINFTGDLLETQVNALLPMESCVVEILEDVQPTPVVLESVAAIKKAGYTIALDDYVGQEHLRPFIPLADIIKIDVLGLSPKKLAALLLGARGMRFRGIFLAEKVEDEKTAEFCRDLGFSLFQGYFFSRPEVIKGKKISTSQAVRMHILSLCVGDNVDLKAVSDAVLHDPLITARFLKFINSAHFGLQQSVQTVHHALALVGPVTFMQWLCVNVLANLDNSRSSHDLAYLASQRAKFLETLGGGLAAKKMLVPPVTVSSLFLIGLFSLLESVIRLPLEEILEGVPLEPDVLNALSGKESPYTPWLSLMNLYERGEWEKSLTLARTLHLTEKDLTTAYTKALDWSSIFFAAV